MKGFIAHISPITDDIEAFGESLLKYKKRAFRLTSCRGVSYGNELKGLLSYSPADGIPDTYFVDDGFDRLSDTISFQTGGLYIQNPSSVLPALILTDLMPDNPCILDMAAAPGGKTCAISDILKRDGVIIANEPSKTRLKALNFNLERYGAWNVKTVSTDGRLLSRSYAGLFDGVLLDAPCSHENKIGTDKNVLSQWSPALVEEMSALQRQLILTGFDCLAPGGVIVYSTCTFSCMENEEVISHLLTERSDAEIIILEHVYSKGVSGCDKVDEAVLRVFPHKTDLDGFFVAALRKKGDLPVKRHISCARSTGDEKFVNEHFSTFPDASFFHSDYEVHLGADTNIGGNFRHSGLGFSKHGMLTAQAVWEFGALINERHRVPLDYEISLDYLKGFDTPVTSEYYGNVFYYRDIPVGIGKPIGNMYKNKLSRYFLYGKNIGW